MWLGPDEARELAEKILAEDRFQPRQPGPLIRPFAWVGEQATRIFNPIGRFFVRVFGPIIGALFAQPIFAAVVISGLLALIFVAARRSAARRVVNFDSAKQAEAGPTVDPVDLERDALAASTSGDHKLAIRLRFRAGLMRLRASGRLPANEVTNGDARMRLGEPDFDELADHFDEIVYGGRAATKEDTSESEARWPRLTGTKR
jgi:hypothetical protein